MHSMLRGHKYFFLHRTFFRTLKSIKYVLILYVIQHRIFQITNIYFIGYWEKDIKTRSAYISSRYQFQCDCNPCSKGWLTNEDLPKGFNDLLPNQLKTDDSDPKLLMQQVTKIQKLGSNISLEQKNGNYKKAYSYCVEFIRVLEETLHRPHCYYLMAEKSLFKLANILYGTTIVQ